MCKTPPVFWQLLYYKCNFLLVFVTTPVHNKVCFHGNFLFFLTTYIKKCYILWQLLLYKCDNLCVDTLAIYVIAYSNLPRVKNIIKIYTSEI